MHEAFLNEFTSLYDKWFPEKDVTVNKKTLNSSKLSKSLVYQLRTCKSYNKNIMIKKKISNQFKLKLGKSITRIK